MTKLSVALLTYNHERFIAQALSSVSSQQLGYPFEIVIGDDASTDRTREIILDFQRSRPDQVRTIFPDRNLGSYGNKMWRQLLEACRGEYIALLDGDDYWTSPQKLQTQVTFLDRHPECSFCFHNVTAFNDEDPSVCWSFARPGQAPMLEVGDLLSENLVATCAVMLRRNGMSQLPDWWESTWMADWALYILNARHGKVGYIDANLGAYRLHSGGMSTSKSYPDFLQERLKLYKYLQVEFGDTYGNLIQNEIARTDCELTLYRTDHLALCERIKETTRKVLPPAATVLVVTNRTNKLIRSDPSHWWEFPGTEELQSEVLFAKARQGVEPAPWICASKAFEFRLYSSAEPKTLLALVRISGSACGILQVMTGSSELGPFAVPVLVWRAGDYPGARVIFSQNGGPERLLAVGAEGSQPLNWISAGETYDFVLTDAADISLAQVRLMRGEKAFVAAEATRFWTGMRLGTTTIVWNTGDGTDGEVYLSEVRPHCPVNSGDAILQLEALRKKGGEFLLFPSTAFWWLQQYQEFRDHLEGTYRCILENQDCIIFHLGSCKEQQTAAWTKAAPTAVGFFG